LEHVISDYNRANEKESGDFNHQRYIQDIESTIAKELKKLAKLLATFEEKQESLKTIQAAYSKKNTI